MSGPPVSMRLGRPSTDSGLSGTGDLAPPGNVRRQRSNPISIRRHGSPDGNSCGGNDGMWISKSMPAPRAPIIGSMTEPSMLKQRIPELTLPAAIEPETVSLSYGNVGSSMSRISASMPTTSFMSVAAVAARQTRAVHGDSAQSRGVDSTENERAMAAMTLADMEKTMGERGPVNRVRSFTGGRTALSVLMEHPTEELLMGIDLDKDDGRRVLMEELEELQSLEMKNGIRERDMLDTGGLDESIDVASTSSHSDVDEEDNDDLFQMAL